MKQLDPFDSPCGRVAIFPLSRRVSLIQRTARALEQRAGQRRKQYWDRIVADLMDELAAAGIGPDAAVPLLREFRFAVQIALSDTHRVNVR